MSFKPDTEYSVLKCLGTIEGEELEFSAWTEWRPPEIYLNTQVFEIPIVFSEANQWVADNAIMKLRQAEQNNSVIAMMVGRLMYFPSLVVKKISDVKTSFNENSFVLHAQVSY